ncbi:UxaA family hydrolase [Agrobacterium rubi]|uniref:Altronate dehydratase n=1 Tax=Agrobacterium rubi TaxID=28099 RepID=A0AAE7REU5_9HYPH|nr:altronate dehydratase family protein [Agrobacterium rubi]NTE88836.1 altronate dehydratase [Agrobacterium rubi]NTF04664.1 altronate dehydratase [Agrobacterium rubi]NTF39226.1 altronate dehydratase [Agrobacterium rubi]OCJ51274.1 galactonate dehydratase [Agrobacterium rubi]QTG02869.1 altronate dehydratase [Agrobacterium rubi]
MLNQTSKAIVLQDIDSVAVVFSAVPAGSSVLVGGSTIQALNDIPNGHKIALRDIQADEPVLKFGQIIGHATAPIKAGEHVHVHNLGMAVLHLGHGIGKNYVPTTIDAKATFKGYKRANGQVATRNYIAVMSSVNCSATVCRMVAAAFTKEKLAAYPNVDGVVAIVHGTGCGMGLGLGFDILRRTLSGYANHANFAGVVFIGLGCEVNQIQSLMGGVTPRAEGLIRSMTIQDSGGTQAAIDAGIAAVSAMLPSANAQQRESVSADKLTLGLQCGGSDGYSGISGNPVLGVAVDMLVANGATAILSETPEIYGAEHLLTARAATPEVGAKLLERIDWWEKYTAENHGDMNNNPSPGNKAGGITTILEKSLGAVAKAGRTGLMEVYQYAEPVTQKGLVFMDTPGYDPVSATGQVAGGANLICFTTGRGSTYGCKPTPSLKIATTTGLYRRMELDMDFNAGVVVDGTSTLEEAGANLFDLILRTASGEHTCSETLGLGDNEFVPWQIGAVM